MTSVLVFGFPGSGDQSKIVVLPFSSPFPPFCDHSSYEGACRHVN